METGTWASNIENGIKSVMGRARKPGVDFAPLGFKVNCKPKG